MNSRVSVILLLLGWTIARSASGAESLGGWEPERPGYDYGPSIIQMGQYRLKWWCGLGPDGQDNIFYQATDTASGASTAPVSVLTRNVMIPWASTHVCDPSVVYGPFSLPWAGTYNFAMYFTATSRPDGLFNSIGVVFSNDGIVWDGMEASYNPILATTPNCIGFQYGVGQTSAWNRSIGAANVQLFYTNTCGVAAIYTVKNIPGDHTGIFFDFTGAAGTGGPVMLSKAGAYPY